MEHLTNSTLSLLYLYILLLQTIKFVTAESNNDKKEAAATEDNSKSVSWIIIVLIIIALIGSFSAFWIIYVIICRRKGSCCFQQDDDESKSRLIPKSPDPYHLSQTSSQHPLRRSSEPSVSKFGTRSSSLQLPSTGYDGHGRRSPLSPRDFDSDEEDESISKIDRIRRTIFIEDSKTGAVRSRSISPNPAYADIQSEPIKMTSKSTSTIHFQ